MGYGLPSMLSEISIIIWLKRKKQEKIYLWSHKSFKYVFIRNKFLHFPGSKEFITFSSLINIS